MPRLPAFAFDIDGVLLRGRKAIPQARPALQLLQHHRVPFLLMTNGGGMTEAKRMAMINHELGLDLHVNQLVQSHTPMRAYAVRDRDSRVLVVGGHGDSARECAESYGFTDVVLPVDLLKWRPAILPHHTYTPHNVQAWARDISGSIDKPFSAVLVFNDPRDMGTDMQVIQDVLNSEGGVIGTRRAQHSPHPAVPIVFSNNDFLWANDYPVPRFGQGMFRMCVERVYEEINGHPLQATILGKPFRVQYDYAAQVLSQLAPGDRSATYMVGDNPASDIMGANDYGWELVLVRTGVYRDEDAALAVATPLLGVFDNVLAGVEAALKREGI